MPSAERSPLPPSRVHPSLQAWGSGKGGWKWEWRWGDGEKGVRVGIVVGDEFSMDWIGAASGTPSVFGL